MACIPAFPKEERFPTGCLFPDKAHSLVVHVPTQEHPLLPEESEPSPTSGKKSAASNADYNLLLETHRVLAPDRVVTVLHSTEAREGGEIWLL